MTELIPITYTDDTPRISGRELHTFLEAGTEYRHWFPRMCDYGFSEGEDFRSFLTESSGGRPAEDHMLSLDMAKEICMLQRTEKGKEARTYFLDLERAWNSPEQLMARALKAADHVQAQLQGQVAALQPKADYYDALIERNHLTNFRDTAKLLNVGEKEFRQYLLDHKYIYLKPSSKPDGRHEYRAYSGKGNGLFELREWHNEKAGRAGLQLMVTPAGRAKFLQLFGGGKAPALPQATGSAPAAALSPGEG